MPVAAPSETSAMKIRFAVTPPSLAFHESVFPDYVSVENPEIRAKFETAWGTSLDPQKGLTVVEIMQAVHADRIKGMYIMGENPAMSDPDLNHVRAALAHLEHLVVQDLFLTETAAFADVVLPASAWPEKDGTVTNTNRQVQMGRRALPLPPVAPSRRPPLAWDPVATGCGGSADRPARSDR